MKKEDYIQFYDEDEDFVHTKYPILSKEDRMSLWIYRLGYGFNDKDPGSQSDPLSKFTTSNYLKWKLIEPDFDVYLKHIIYEYLIIWNVRYEGIGDHSLEEEIYRRLTG